MTRFVGFDLETTGISSFTDALVSFAFVERGPNGDLLRDHGLVNPGTSIPRGATSIHGITDDMVRDAPSLEVATKTIIDHLRDVWADGGVVVGMNVSYDLTMVQYLGARLGLDGLTAAGPVGPVFDVLVLDRHFDKWRKGARKLGDLCALYGVSNDQAHSAADDALASLEVFEALAEKFPEIMMIPSDAINDQLSEWYRDWLSSFSRYLEKKGEAPIAPGRYEWPIHLED